MIEEWRAIPGYEGLYEVSNLGRVRGAKRRGTSGALLRLTQDKSGYTKLNLYKNSQRKGFWLHSLILETFIGPRPPGMQACHGDGVRGHNVLSNLRWDTRSANYDDSRRHGTATVGDRNPATKLSATDRAEIPKLRGQGLLQREIAARLNICQQTVSEILKRDANATR